MALSVLRLTQYAVISVLRLLQRILLLRQCLKGISRPAVFIFQILKRLVTQLRALLCVSHRLSKFLLAVQCENYSDFIRHNFPH